MELLRRTRASAAAAWGRFRAGAEAAGAGALVALLAVLPDLVGLVGLGLCVAGVHENWGRGWALIAAGGPVVIAYAWREVRPTLRSRRG